VLIVVPDEQNRRDFGFRKAAKLRREGFRDVGRWRGVGKRIAAKQDEIHVTIDRRIDTARQALDKVNQAGIESRCRIEFAMRSATAQMDIR
jgi:hypothetical protein